MHGRDILRAAFRANASFSLACAAALTVGAPWLGPEVGLPSPRPLVVVGLGLVPFAAWLIWLARGPGLNVRTGRTLVTMDVSWVVGTFALLAIWPDLFNATGRALALSIALVVAGFAAWQLVGVRRLASPA